MSKPKAKLLLCGPRGFCAGVDRAIQIVVLALKKYGAPVYVRHEIVHNRYVVEGLENLGAIFVKDLDEIPETEQPVIFSAHGVPKSVPAAAASRNMLYLDATCPLVSKVHKQAISHSRKGRHVLLVGHRGHPEVIGTMGQLPKGAVTLIETVEDVDNFVPNTAEGLGYVTQTTLSVDDTSDIIARMEERFEQLQAPAAESICYATTNRQESVKAAAPASDVFLVVGAPNSSNSNRLVDVASRAGAKTAKLVQNAGEIDWADMDGYGDDLTIGLSAGASAPELLVEGIVEACRERFDLSVELAETTVEDEQFLVMRELRDVPLEAADMSFVNGSA
ncbi:MAG: 4-hydroxy-3-methylbut-2-enyl diphosphate reductase [Rhizobiaceae bacterium]|nr:4-hydroxy-3-methylbut-2-enyl diphosphate reductase [Hyphomicrobiales bacterium]NRB29517.1 4-hydroxy-3-methylbut-2-enyl diphosphate reductase [Rhizobiaceae bacterium]